MSVGAALPLRSCVGRLPSSRPKARRQVRGVGIAFLKTRRRSSLAFPITRSLATWRTRAAWKFAVDWRIPNRNANRPLQLGSGPRRRASCPQAREAPIVVSGVMRRVIRIRASCYRALGTVLSDSIHRPRIGGFPWLLAIGRLSNFITKRDNSPNGYACGGF